MDRRLRRESADSRIGIRVAVGATPAGVARFMAGEGARRRDRRRHRAALALGGAQHAILLLGMNPYDPLAFGGAAADHSPLPPLHRSARRAAR